MYLSNKPGFEAILVELDIPATKKSDVTTDMSVQAPSDGLGDISLALEIIALGKRLREAIRQPKGGGGEESA